MNTVVLVPGACHILRMVRTKDSGGFDLGILNKAAAPLNVNLLGRFE